MFLPNKSYKNGKGKLFTIVLHNLHGKFPLTAKNEKGKLEKFTREGHYYEKKTSELDLIEGEVK
jgi:hypothetical protein